MGLQTDTSDRISECLNRQARLTLGEVELLHAIGGKKEVNLSQLEERELKNIERKLGLV